MRSILLIPTVGDGPNGVGETSGTGKMLEDGAPFGRVEVGAALGETENIEYGLRGNFLKTSQDFEKHTLN